MHYSIAAISDLHLLSSKTQTDQLYLFLKENSFDHLILVGDILDLWRIQIHKFSNENANAHIDIIRRLLKLIKNGTKITWVVGNHDIMVWNLLSYKDASIGNIEVVREKVVEIDGKKYLFIHGDIFDLFVTKSPKLAKFADHFYHLAIWLNKSLNWCRSKLGLRYWSLSAYLKGKAKKWSKLSETFARSCVIAAKERDCAGVIAGHIHHAERRFVDDIEYINCGCWTEREFCHAVIWNNGWQLINVRIEYGTNNIEKEVG